MLTTDAILKHSMLDASDLILGTILASVSGKCPGFCKCLSFLKYGFAQFSNSAGHQKRPALSASNQWSMMVMETIYVEIIDKLFLKVHVRRRLYVS